MSAQIVAPAVASAAVSPEVKSTAQLIPKASRMSFVLNAGVNPGTGVIKKESVSISKLIPGTDPDILKVVSDSVSNLLYKNVISVNIIDTSMLV